MVKKIENIKEVVPRAAFWRQVLVLLPVYLNVFMMGCTTGWITFAIYFFNKGDEVSTTPAEAALIISSTDIGRFLMAIPGGIIVDKFGRKNMMIGLVFLYMLSWLALSLNANFPTIFIVRFILGIAVAFENSTGMVVIGELASPRIRAKLAALYMQFWTFGMGSQIVIGVLFMSYFTLSYCTLAMSSLNCVFIYWALETPNYLISVSQNEKAMKNLKYVRPGYTEIEITAEFEKMKNAIEMENQRKLDGNWLHFLKSKEISRPILILFSMNFFYMATGFNTFTAYVTIIVPENEFISKEYYSLVMFIFHLIIAFMLPLYIEKFPRRILLTYGIIALFSCLLLLTGTYFCYSEYQSNTCKWIFTIVFLITSVVVRGSVHPMVSMLRVEILPQSVRGFGGSLAAISSSLGCIIIVLVFNFISDNFGMLYNFILYAANCLILFFLAYNLVPECRGKFLSDIKVGIEDNTKLNTI